MNSCLQIWHCHRNHLRLFFSRACVSATLARQLACASPTGPRHAQPDWIGDGLSLKQMMHRSFSPAYVSEGGGIKMAELATGNLTVRQGSCGRSLTSCGSRARLGQGGGHDIAGQGASPAEKATLANSPTNFIFCTPAPGRCLWARGPVGAHALTQPCERFFHSLVFFLFSVGCVDEWAP